VSFNRLFSSNRLFSRQVRCSRSYGRILAGVLALAALGLAGCQKEKAGGPPPHFAVLRFENLTGDPSLEWTARAASEVLAVEIESGMEGPVLPSSAVSRGVQSLGAHMASAPGISAERQAALLAGAGRLITGYVTRENGRLRITASEEDAATGKNVRTLSAAGSTFEAAINALAGGLTTKPRPYFTGRTDAVRYYAAALESPGEAGAQGFRKALEADPDFGPAWVASAVLDASRGDRAAFTATLEQAARRKLDGFSRAQLELEASALSGDRKQRLAAMHKVSDLSPADGTLLRSVAEAEVAAGEFKAGAADWQRVTAQSPDDWAAWNSLSYARSYAGDYKGALEAIGAYAKLRPNDANPLDSAGDIHYEFGKFAEAAASYAQAGQKDANFERQGYLYKAAWAKFRAGDRAGADKLMADFSTARQKQPDAVLPLQQAAWLYRTGRAEQAIAMLRKLAAAEPSGPGDASLAQNRANALSQLAVWELLAGDRAKAAADVAASGKPTSIPALLTAFSSMPSAPVAEWETRAQHLFPAPQMQGLRRTALGYALLLDGKREAALPVWKEIAAAEPGDFLSAAIFARLEGRKPALEVLPTPDSANGFLAVLDQLSR